MYACATCTRAESPLSAGGKVEGAQGGTEGGSEGVLAGVCLACSLHCHEGHDLYELYTKRSVL